MLFYHKGLRGRKAPLPFVACARKTVILRGQIWSAHESDVVGVFTPSLFSAVTMMVLVTTFMAPPLLKYLVPSGPQTPPPPPPEGIEELVMKP
jgi:hypothetical protein